MNKEHQLKREAREAASFRGHILSRFTRNVFWHSKYVGWATCIKCGAMCSINTAPQPNDIEISGQAVALDCEYSLVMKPSGRRVKQC